MTGAMAGNLVGLALWALVLGIFLWRRAPLAGTKDIGARAALWLLLPPLAFLLRGLLGDLSFAAPVIAFWLAAPPALTFARNAVVAAVLAAIGIALSLSALGFIATDFYASGYGHPAFLFAVATALTCAWFAARPLAFAWIAGLCLHAAGITPSPNLWDTLIDLPTTIMGATFALHAWRKPA